MCRDLRAQGKSVAAFKPVISGFDEQDFADSDSAHLLQSLDKNPSLENIKTITPWRFQAPLSPDMAAWRENREIDFPALIDYCRQALAGPEDVKIIEGVGGVMVPLTESHTVLDWIITLDLPTIVVVGSYLGTISHTLTAVGILESRNVKIEEIVVSESEESPVEIKETIDVLQRFLPHLTITDLPRLRL